MIATTAPSLPPPELFDVTIRDGSYVIDFQFQPEDVRLLCRALEQCGLRYVEVGHGLGLNASAVKEAAAASDEEYLSAAAESCAGARFGAFFIPSIGTFEHLRRARRDFGMHFIRIGNEPDKAEAMLPFVAYAKELGYEVMCNFMKTYGAPPGEVAQKSISLSRAGADVIYVVDSAGGMLPEEVGAYVRAIAEACPARVGFHGHNNLELAISNSLAAWRNGATLIDCSVGGLGRSSGNTRTELMIPVLKALGVPMPYDFEGILRIWKEIVQPLLLRRPATAQEIVGGYARVHSGQMGPFADAARRHGVNLVSLLNAYGDAVHAAEDPGSVDRLAACLKLQSAPEAGQVGSLLHLHGGGDSFSIRNTFRSFDEVLRAVKALAHKACLPVAAIVEVAMASGDDPYLVAEYLYHDDHFIVLRAAFGSVASFVDVMRRQRGWCDVLLFEGQSVAVRTELAVLESQWRHGQRVYWADLSGAKYHALFSALHNLALEQSAHSILLLGGNPSMLARLAPPTLDQLDLYCTGVDPQTPARFTIRRLNRDTGAAAAGQQARPAQFDIAVILSPLGHADLEMAATWLKSGGVLVDCAGSCRGLKRTIGRGIIELSLWPAVTGELLMLQNTAHLLADSQHPGGFTKAA